MKNKELLGLLLLAGIPLALAHGPVDPDASGASHPTGHLRDHADETWPPQPRGMSNPVALNNPAGERRVADARKRRAAELDRMAQGRPDVRAALGRRHSPPAVTLDTDRAMKAGEGRLVYFSHTNNSTVEVLLSGHRVSTVRSIPPAEYQPYVTNEEIAEADSLARAHFNNLGKARVAALEGYGLLAHLPTGTGFYDTRVVYMSFHANREAPPEYEAWVDLTRQTVLRTREEQPGVQPGLQPVVQP